MTGHEVSALPQQAQAFQGQPAGIVSRTLAVVIDVVVVASMLVAGYLAVSVVLFAWNPRTFSFPAPSGWFTIAAAGAVSVVYLTAGWWIAGRSYGCAVMGLRVVGRDDQEVHFVAALLRAVICLVFPLGLGWCAVDRKDRAVHDLLTHTHVIHDWRHRER
jgi:uncharacterized RDD family membrane protein YckC